MSDQVVSIAAAAAVGIAEEVRAFGHRSLETGGFLLTHRDDGNLSIVAFAGDAGIMRCRDLFQVSERALARLFEFADDHDLYAPAQFHSHRLGPSLSGTDKAHGLRAEGFTSAVVPSYTAPPQSVTGWGWWSFHRGSWVDSSPPALATTETTVIEFDENDIRVR